MIWYASLHFPAFAAAVARRDDEALATVPLLFVDQAARTIVAVSAEAHAAGVAPGMLLRQAQLRCPQACVLPAKPEGDQVAYDTIIALLQAFSPRIARHPLGQDARVDVDLGRGTPAQLVVQAEHIATTIAAQTRLTPAIGIATTCFVAQLAAQYAALGQLASITPATQPAFLAPLSVALLPVDRVVIARLWNFGLRTFEQLAEVPVDALQAQFGTVGRELFALCRGIDRTLFVSEQLPAARAVARRFDGPVLDMLVLEAALRACAANLARRLATGGVAARTLILALDLDDSPPWVMEHTLVAPTTRDDVLLQHLSAMLCSAGITSGVTKLTIRLPAPVPLTTGQLTLFPPERGSHEQRAQVLAALAPRLQARIVRAALAVPDDYLAERRVTFHHWEER